MCPLVAGPAERSKMFSAIVIFPLVTCSGAASLSMPFGERVLHSGEERLTPGETFRTNEASFRMKTRHTARQCTIDPGRMVATACRARV